MAAATYGRRLVVILGAAVAVIVPVYVLGSAGVCIADATCTPDEAFWGDLNCLDNEVTGMMIGAIAGLAIGVASSVRFVRVMRRRSPTP